MTSTSDLGCRRCGRGSSVLGGPLLQCSKCKWTPYCSVECQRQDWKHGNHKEECQLAQKSGFRLHGRFPKEMGSWIDENEEPIVHAAAACLKFDDPDPRKRLNRTHGLVIRALLAAQEDTGTRTDFLMMGCVTVELRVLVHNPFASNFASLQAEHWRTDNEAHELFVIQMELFNTKTDAIGVQCAVQAVWPQQLAATMGNFDWQKFFRQEPRHNVDVPSAQRPFWEAFVRNRDSHRSR